MGCFLWNINIKIKNKGLKVKDIMLLLKKLIRLSYVDKSIQSINLVETYAYGKKDNKWWTKKLCNNII